MPYQDIKNLLDRQEYREALEMARKEYEANAGLWEARTLFRCLYYNAKAAANDNDNDSASEFMKQMSLLYNEHDLNDDINNGMLERARRFRQAYSCNKRTPKPKPATAKAHTSPYRRYTMTANYPRTKRTPTAG